MDDTRIKNLFTLFSGEEYTQEHSPVVQLAITETQKILRDPGTLDGRVDFLCAAAGNYRWQQICSAHDRSEYTYAGEMSKVSNYSVLTFAENLLRDYYNMCADIIKPQNFVFMGFAAGEDLNDTHSQ